MSIQNNFNNNLRDMAYWSSLQSINKSISSLGQYNSYKDVCEAITKVKMSIAEHASAGQDTAPLEDLMHELLIKKSEIETNMKNQEAKKRRNAWIVGTIILIVILAAYGWAYSSMI